MRLGPTHARLSKKTSVVKYGRYSITKRSPPIDEQRNYIKASLISLEREIQKHELFWKDYPLKVATYDQIKEKLATLGMSANYIDIEFPPTDKSI